MSKNKQIISIAVENWYRVLFSNKNKIPIDIIHLIAGFAKNVLKFNADWCPDLLIVSNDGLTICRTQMSGFQFTMSKEPIPIYYVSSNTYQKLGFQISNNDNKHLTYEIKDFCFFALFLYFFFSFCRLFINFNCEFA